MLLIKGGILSCAGRLRNIQVPSDERRGYANRYKPKVIDTPAGRVTHNVPKTASHDS